MNTIPKKVLQGLGQIVTETGKEVLKNVVEATDSVISGEALLGNITNLSEQELAQRKAEDERQRKQEIDQMMAKIAGRNVEGEMKQVDQEKQRIEEQKLREEQQRQSQPQQTAPVEMESNNPSKRKKKRGSAMGGGKKKTNQPDPSAMSQTNEKAGKME